MKKKITTEQELFLQLASHGDAAAFFSMISSSLKDYFLKLSSHGDSVEDSAHKVFEVAETLFKKLQHAHPDNFDHWLETEFSALSHNGNSEHEVILDKNLFIHSEKVLVETQRLLFRVASTIKNAKQRKGMPVFFARHKIAISIAAAVLLVSIASIVLYGYYGLRLDMSFLKVKGDKSTLKADSVAVAVTDTIKKADSVVSSVPSNPQVQETKAPAPAPTPPVPKPRPRVTYTPPATSEDGSGTYQSPRTSTYDQSQQSSPSRSERASQQSSYSSQTQSSENTSTSSYNSSGTSTYPSQQSTQSPSQSSSEPNQP